MASADHTTFTSVHLDSVSRIKPGPATFRVRTASESLVERRKFRVNQSELSGFLVSTVSLCAVAYLMGQMFGI